VKQCKIIIKNYFLNSKQTKNEIHSIIMLPLQHLLDAHNPEKPNDDVAAHG